MKRIILFIILLLMPFFVYAEKCNPNDIVIEDIKLTSEKSDSVVELDEASINDNNSVKLNLRMKNLNDYAKYKLTIKNNSTEDYEISSSNLLGNQNGYITYKIEGIDNSNIIPAGTQKEVFLLATYSKLVPQTMFTNGKYSESKTIPINLSAGKEEIVSNPKTGVSSYIFILIMFIIGFSLIYLILNKSKYSKYFVLLALLVLPLGIDAICKVCLNIESNVEIEKSEDRAYLMGGTDTDSNAVYLRTDGAGIFKKDIEKITFVNSIEGHSTQDSNCYDVSVNEDGKVLGWFTDVDNNGMYEMTIGAKDKVYASRGEYLFLALINLKTIEGMEYFDTSEVTNMESMFEGTRSLTTLDLSHFDTRIVNNMSRMFWLEPPGSGPTYDNLTKIDCSSFDTKNVTNMSGMFANRGVTTEIIVSSFDTSNVKDMSSMFSGCRSVLSLNLDHFDTKKVENMSEMFAACFKLTNLNINHFNTSNVTDMSSMFAACGSITSLNLNHFDTKKVENMSGMFAEGYKITSISMNNFNTSNVTNMSYMFSNCKSLVSIDLNGFDTSNVTDMSSMFAYNTLLETIKVSSNFKTTNVTNSSNMFWNSTSLKGGAGTTYNRDKTDKEYARVDGGSSSPGYFTDESVLH